jgi:putative colanic acid biosynthesis glycosyltransferase
MLSLTIITVTYNDYQALVRTTESIENYLNLYPGYRNSVEHIIVDGNSQDDTLIFLKKLKTSTIRHFISEGDQGIYDAMNKGIRISNGKFIVFLNAGDEIYRKFQLDHLFSSLSLLEDDLGVAGIAFSAIMRFKSRDFVVKARMVDRLRPRMPTIHQSIFYKKSILEKYPYDIGYRICGDYDSCLKILKSGYHFKFSSDIFSIFYAGGTSSNNLSQLYKESTLATIIHLNPPLLLLCWIKFRLIFSLIMMRFLLSVFKTSS